MAGTPEKFSFWPQALVKWIPWNPSGTGVMSWFFRCEWKALLPLCSQQGPAQLHITLQPGLDSKFPLAQSPPKISICRADPVVEGVPGHIQTPAWHSGTTPLLWPILPGLCSSHQPAQHLCPGVLSKAP